MNFSLNRLLSAGALTMTLLTSVAGAQVADSHLKNAPTPPMGWNSWDNFGTTLNEAQAKSQADAIARHLKPAGWDVFTVDIQWYEPSAKGHGYVEGAPLAMDEFSRLLPAPQKFPSAADGAGFKPLADYVHAKGLKFGIHILRGIARQAVQRNTPIKGADVRAADIALTTSTCAWNPDMYGVDMRKPGAQAYYDSLFQMYAAWGVDFVKVDDISRPYDDVQKAEIEAIRKAIDKTGRPIVLSLSPGDTPVAQGAHVNRFANMWRVSDDFWDRWHPLYEMFGRLDRWTPHRREGAWPDADMLPFGVVEFGRPTRFTRDEQLLCMTLWCIARSPLIFGGDVTRLDPFTLELLTNPEVLAVNQASTNNRQVSRDGDLIVWAADVPDSRDRYVALFNAQGTDVPYDLAKAACKSPVLRGPAGRDVAEISVPIAGARSLVLVVTDAGDGLSFDHADWIEPTLRGPKGTMSLTDLKWTTATAGFGQTRVNRTAEDHPLRLNGKPVAGIGTHSVSSVTFDLPEGYDTFSAKGVLSAASGGKGSVEFAVFVDTDRPVVPFRSPVSVSLADLGINGPATIRDLWARENVGVYQGRFTRNIPLHGAGLYRVSPE